MYCELSLQCFIGVLDDSTSVSVYANEHDDDFLEFSGIASEIPFRCLGWEIKEIQITRNTMIIILDMD